ncbi:serine hydrolase domain-containing protein [Oceanobacillus halotolerans]|uniref:serine hydrolase domain-containing protein n=1 Tax=Oceanobacillus halotolerans TaxID=2663380 RepID=UPI0013D9A7A0|nr:serine hydrolase domain-containing protein [Oceanobacillus halotolerans]
MKVNQDFTALDEALTAIQESKQIPGMAVVVAKEGEPIYEKYAGYRDVEKKLPVTPDTIFGVASITKSVTALAVMQLQDAQKLSVLDPITKWLPELKLPESLEKEPTIHHLLTHTAGFPGMKAVHQARRTSIQKDPDGGYLFDVLADLPKEPTVETVEDMIQLINETPYEMLGVPGTVFNYSNEGYAMLQGIIERASGMDYIPFVQEHILDPLQMDRATFLRADLHHDADVTELYAYQKDPTKKPFHSPAWWDTRNLYANGSLKASVTDLVRYLEVYRNNGFVNGKQIVSSESIQAMTTAHVRMPTGDQYGYGLQVDDYNGMKLFGHGGSIKGVSSHMKVVKEEELTMVVLTNIQDVNVENIISSVMDHLVDMDKKTTASKSEMPGNEQLHKYVGRYESAEGQQITFLRKNNKLYWKVQQQEAPVTPYEEHGFMTTEGKKMKFIVNDQDDVIGVFSGVRFIPKQKGAD